MRCCEDAARELDQAHLDLLFLEATAAGCTAWAAARSQRRNYAGPAALVVVGSLEDYTREVFEMDAADYLLSSCSMSRFSQAITKVRQQTEIRDSRRRYPELLPWAGCPLPGRPRDAAPVRSLFVEDGERFVHLDCSSIRLIEAAGNYVAIHAGRSIFCHRSSISSLEAALDATSFVRIHKSTIVNLQHVESVRKNGKGGFIFQLTDDTACVSGVSYRARIWRLLKPQSVRYVTGTDSVAIGDEPPTSEQVLVGTGEAAARLLQWRNGPS